MDSRYKIQIGKQVANSAPTPVNPTDDSKEVVNVEYLHGKLADAGGSGTVVSNITPVTQNYLLTSTSNNAILRVKDYASVIVPSGLGLKHRTVIKKATGKTVSLVEGENVVLETPSGYLAEVLAQNDAIEIVCEEITNGIEYWGVYGALAEQKYPYGIKEFLNFDNALTIATPEAIFPQIHKSSDFPELTTTKDYFFLYSTDHAESNAGVVKWAECDDPEGTGFIERGTIVSGYQAESPCLIRIPTAKSGIGEEIFLYYHTLNEPGHTATQETRLKTTSGGAELHLCSWTDRGRPLGVETNETHTGYLCVNEASDGTYFGYHLTNLSTANDASRGISTSTDGLTWTRVTSQLSQTNAMPSGFMLATRSAILPFYYNSNLYAIINYRDANDLTIWKTGVFTLDAQFKPLAFIKELGDFGTHDTTPYIDSGIIYIFPFFDYDPQPLYGAIDDYFFIKKYYLASLV